ncbi:MAG: rhomboid family intramembrane serine protease [Proteobacteria bacterium]|nr:rhomboid family intramembrane serine protease [Pseudomonadota bacterium]
MTEPQGITYDEPAVGERGPRLTSAVQLLLLASVATWVLQLTLVTPGDMQSALGFSSHTLTDRWWTIVTYSFVHADGWHLAMNGYALWLFGPRVEARWGSGPFVRFYLLCALGGWFAHLVFGAPGTTLIGSTAAVAGVALAYARTWPNETVHLFGTVPATSRWLAYLVIMLLLLDGTLSPEIGLGTAYLAHLGGLAAAGMALRATPSATLERLRRSVNAVPDEPDEPMPRAIPRSAPRTRPAEHAIDDIVAQANASPVPRPASRTARQAETPPSETLDRLLDKISQHGIASLSSDEKRWLEEASKKLQRGDGTDAR